MTEITHRFVETNGIRMHIAETGPADGPLVLLCHGFPELWYSWRHQIRALAAAGYHAVAPDQRGYDGTDCPRPVEAYDVTNLVGDLVGLVEALGHDSAVVVGHDWGAIVAFYAGLFRPDLFRGVGLLSVAYFPRSRARPTDLMRKLAGSQDYYQLYFQELGKADAEFAEDTRGNLGAMYWTFSGEGLGRGGTFGPLLFEKGKRFVDGLYRPERMPDWLNDQDLDVFAEAFEKSGFHGPVSWYRNFDRNWEVTSYLDGAKLLPPTLFVAGDRDVTIPMFGAALDNMEALVPNLTKKILIPGIGHWVQQEAPEEVNRLLLEFLGEVSPVG